MFVRATDDKAQRGMVVPTVRPTVEGRMTDKPKPAEPLLAVEAPNTNKEWGTVADQLDETMRQRLLDFGKKIV